MKNENRFGCHYSFDQIKQQQRQQQQTEDNNKKSIDELMFFCMQFFLLVQLLLCVVRVPQGVCVLKYCHIQTCK